MSSKDCVTCRIAASKLFYHYQFKDEFLLQYTYEEAVYIKKASYFCNDDVPFYSLLQRLKPQNKKERPPEHTIGRRVWLSIEVISRNKRSYVAFLKTGSIRIDGKYYHYNEDLALLVMKRLPDKILSVFRKGVVWYEPAQQVLMERKQKNIIEQRKKN